MRSGKTVGLLALTMVAGLAACGGAETGEAGGAMEGTAAVSSERLNPMIALHEQDLPVFGISHPAITAGRGGRGRGGEADTPPPPPPDLGAAANETLAYGLADFQYASGANEAFLEYTDRLIEAGGTARTHAFIAKTGVFHEAPDESTADIHNQLNAGHVGIMTEAIESPEELQQAIAAMRFTSKGGTRPESGFERAAAYWGMTPEEYVQKADVWPLNPEGELIVWAIVESEEGLANVREIAGTPGLGVLWAGAGTLGGVFSSEDANGERVRDEEGFNAAIASILAACREFDVPCGYPASNPEDIERLMAEGWSVFVMQGRNDNGFAAIDAGRRISNRPTNAVATTPH